MTHSATADAPPAQPASGRVALVCGVANDRSIATAIARELVADGWQIALTWQSERTRARVEHVRDQLQPEAWCGQLDVTLPATVNATVEALRQRHGQLHGLVHSLAFGRLADDQGQALRVIDCDSERYSEAIQISAHSLPLLCQACEPLFATDASVVALSYLGGVRVLDGYNLMGVAKAALESSVRYAAHELGPAGVRVNALRAGPLRTLAASGVPGFRDRAANHAQKNFLQRAISTEEVARTAAFLLAPASSAITGACIDADGGASLAH